MKRLMMLLFASVASSATEVQIKRNLQAWEQQYLIDYELGKISKVAANDLKWKRFVKQHPEHAKTLKELRAWSDQVNDFDITVPSAIDVKSGKSQISPNSDSPFGSGRAAQTKEVADLYRARLFDLKDLGKPDDSRRPLSDWARGLRTAEAHLDSKEFDAYAKKLAVMSDEELRKEAIRTYNFGTDSCRFGETGVNIFRLAAKLGLGPEANQLRFSDAQARKMFLGDDSLCRKTLLQNIAANALAKDRRASGALKRKVLEQIKPKERGH